MQILKHLLDLLPLSPRKLRFAAVLFAAIALCLLTGGCSSVQAGTACAGLRGFSSASQGMDYGADIPGTIQPQRHAREHSLAATRVSETAHRGSGRSL